MIDVAEWYVADGQHDRAGKDQLLPRHWRKGLASEGARELVRYGLDDLGLDRIIAQTMTVNAGSRAVMERIGLTYVRTFPTSMTALVEGVDEGEVEYEMTHEQWKRGSSHGDTAPACGNVPDAEGTSDRHFRLTDHTADQAAAFARRVSAKSQEPRRSGG